MKSILVEVKVFFSKLDYFFFEFIKTNPNNRLIHLYKQRNNIKKISKLIWNNFFNNFKKSLELSCDWITSGVILWHIFLKRERVKISKCHFWGKNIFPPFHMRWYLWRVLNALGESRGMKYGTLFTWPYL